ncbi:MAG TPA: prepilin-type N-terminal cleavage/methylation domain-containing protein [Thermoanaerobaculia bacterium]|nr:prepilin-type N-terminal cleavage/methylation domain-containing protein [Thermoanaerobaculia bacterium]
MRDATHRRLERGYNLVEVLIAMALLGTVLMSILTLFVFGRRNVYSGKQMTKATSVTNQVLEDLQPLGTSTLYTNFKITSTTSTTSPTIAGVQYSNVIVRSTADTTGDFADGPKYLARWKALIPAGQLKDGKVTMVIIPDEKKTSTDPTSAAFVRIRVITEWEEGSRARNVTADLAKFNRSF